LVTKEAVAQAMQEAYRERAIDGHTGARCFCQEAGRAKKGCMEDGTGGSCKKDKRVAKAVPAGR
jgi:hypothetical protein